MRNALLDSATMLRRNLRRMQRYPVAAASTIAVPIVLLLRAAQGAAKRLYNRDPTA